MKHTEWIDVDTIYAYDICACIGTIWNDIAPKHLTTR